MIRTRRRPLLRAPAAARHSRTAAASAKRRIYETEWVIVAE